MEVLELTFSYIPTKSLLHYGGIEIISDLASKTLMERNVEVIITWPTSIQIHNDWDTEAGGDEIMLKPRTLHLREDRNSLKFTTEFFEECIEIMNGFPNWKPNLTVHGSDYLMLPTSLERLSVGFSSPQAIHRNRILTRFNVSKLENLTNLKLSDFCSPTLNALKAPKQIKVLEIESRELVSLDGIQEYKQLKDLKLTVFHVDAEQILNCPLPNSITSLCFEWFYRSFEPFKIATAIRRLETGQGIKPIRLPPNLRVLHVHSAQLCPQNWIFPTSLRVLILNVPIIPPHLQLPPNLILLDIHGYSTTSLPDPLPKPLVRIRTSLLPANNDSLSKLANLTHVDFDFEKQPIASFDWKLPKNLRRLILKYDRLRSLKTDVPNLRVVDLTLNSLSMFEELQLPDSVLKLKLIFCWRTRNRYSLEFSITDRHKFPKNLRHLELPDGIVDTLTLINLNLKTFHDLQFINLSGNKITEINCGTFPSSTKTLILSANELKRVHANVFKELPNLKCLELEQNKLGKNSQFRQRIEFPDSLESLDLSQNYLRNFDDLIFPPNPRLKWIQLSHNQFQTNEEEIRNTLKQKLKGAVIYVDSHGPPTPASGLGATVADIYAIKTPRSPFKSPSILEDH
ncbi:uncharacterized protein J8A68_005378 [[Candida] subhashii]|uniref:Uncharacterized protein n=1 Tax=[Candida] subhashii TaxID=561895 RepID=A0A8J5Q3A9_9ASCO|nr:uncharacterized protein J8A68_005378 [[Candida] subhashii]KAG7661109.1 hypothetical protein J8A68_005378 [[Candida] subhashii]